MSLCTAAYLRELAGSPVGNVKGHRDGLRDAADEIDRLLRLIAGIEIALARDDDISAAMRLIVAERSNRQIMADDTDTTINPDTSDWTDRERAYYAHGWNDATRSTAAEIERLRAALEEIIQHAQLGSRPWVVIPDHLIEKAKAAIQQLADKDRP